MLEEFRDALRAEIEVARRNAVNTAVPLVSGRRIARVGGSFQYAFKVESLLELPDDSPADLVVPGMGGPIEATIVSVEGLNIVVSVGLDLGAFVPAARLQTDLTLLLRKLITRIEDKRDLPNHAADRLLGLQPASGQPTALANTHSLNPEQLDATASSLGRDTTFIFGPPGTGKTHTIGAIGAELYHAGRSCLIVSHTNIAVDGAILSINERLAGQFRPGSVLRVGVPKDDRLLDPKKKELLLATHVERRQAELVARKQALEAERAPLVTESKRLHGQIEIAVWAQEGGEDINRIKATVLELEQVEVRLGTMEKRLAELRRTRPDWVVRGRLARVLLKKLQDAAFVRAQRTSSLERERASLEEQREQKTALLKATRVHLETARQAESLRHQLSQFPGQPTLEIGLRNADQTVSQTTSQLNELVPKLENAKRFLERAQSVGMIRRALLGLPNPEKQAAEISRLKSQILQATSSRDTAAKTARVTKAQLEQVQSLTRQLVALGSVSSSKVLEGTIAIDERRLHELQNKIQQVHASLAELANAAKTLQAEAAAFEREYGASPADVAEASLQSEEEMSALETERRELNEKWLRDRSTTEELLRSQIEELARWNLCDAEFGTAVEMLTILKSAYRRACEASPGADLETLRATKRGIDQRIIQMDAEIEAINQALARVESDLIAEATIVATTLTRAYLRDSIQGRGFDTVILDEASMAAIPALWAAASLASRNVVAVGDFKQLPPIVQADRHELAKKWLGRDIFEAGGVSQAWGRGQPPEFFVELKVQRRMHPSISAISNHLVYRDTLKDDPWVQSPTREEELRRWYRHDWGHDAPVLLVDAGSTNAWVTSVARGGSVSRLNFLSATVCVDLAEQILHAERPRAGRKILVVSPYRPHARLVNLLLQETGLRNKESPEEDEVVSGTVHSFQGSEADVVILDFVIDRPHFQARIFDPKTDSDHRRLFNVALTRAKRRLIVVGDFEWCLKCGKHAFLGRELIPLLLAKYPRVEAAQILPNGLAARAAKAHLETLGGDVEPKESRLVVTQEHFYRLLYADIARAKRRVVIYSPFLTSARIETLQVHFRAAFERGVTLYVITKPPHERKKSELQACREAESILRGIGVKLIHKEGMHEKLIFLDNDLLWGGSLNPLSHSRTQEVMERRASESVVADYAKTLRLAELLAAFEGDAQRCPICGSEIIASEGGDGDPFYWRCSVDGCYSRGVDDPPLQNGMISLACDSKIKFDWRRDKSWPDGEKPVWTCDCVHPHWQKFHPNHLRLPKMKALIGKANLRRVEKLFAQWKQGNRSSPGSHQQTFGI